MDFDHGDHKILFGQTQLKVERMFILLEPPPHPLRPYSRTLPPRFHPLADGGWDTPRDWN